MLTKTQVVRAQDMGNAVMLDPQFQIPKFPLYSKNLVQIQTEEGIIFDGLEKKQLLKGKATEQFLPLLLQTLDGNQSLFELSSKLNQFSDKAKYNALALLYTRGLLQENHTENSEQPLVQYMERHLDQTRYNTSATESMDRLRETTFVIYSPNYKNTQLTKELEKYPVKFDYYSHDSLQNYETVKRIGIGYCSDVKDLSRFYEFDKNMRENDIPWILLVNNSRQVHIGPYFSNTFCFDCYMKQIDVADNDESKSRNIHLEDSGIAMAVTEIINFISRISSLAIHKGVKVLNVNEISSSFHFITKVPSCKYCDPTNNGSSTLNEVLEYENTISFPPYQFLNPKDHQNHYKPSNLALSKLSKEYFSVPKIALQDNESLPKLNRNEFGEVTLDILAKLLLYSFGFNKESEENKIGKAKRWAPTGGNLGSTNAYFVNKSVEGIVPGTYYYQADDHSLAVLSTSEPIERFEQMISGNSDENETVGYLVLTGNFSKVRQKYYDFAYRIINLDAGVALTQLRVAAESLNMRINIHGFKNDEIEEWVDIESPNEIVTLVISLFERGDQH
jgi:SagB-type dehydrogenase family enzyme